MCMYVFVYMRILTFVYMCILTYGYIHNIKLHISYDIICIHYIINYNICIGNSNTVGGGLVPPLADLGTLAGLEAGGKEPLAMIDGTYRCVCIKTRMNMYVRYICRYLRDFDICILPPILTPPTVNSQVEYLMEQRRIKIRKCVI
jgi:hypothetical protein